MYVVKMSPEEEIRMANFINTMNEWSDDVNLGVLVINNYSCLLSDCAYRQLEICMYMGGF